MTEFHALRMGQVNAYLVRGREGYLLVDAGLPRKEGVLYAWLEERGGDPGEVRLAVITHVHFDHVGSLRAIQARTGCTVAVPAREAGILERGEVAIPPGTRWFSRPFLAVARRSPRIRSWFRYPPVTPDRLLRGETSLAEFGFAARVLPTPGHTADSVSVLTDDGLAFVGDLAPNDLPFGLGPIYNAFGEDGPAMVRGWETLLEAGAHTFLPAHGAPFDAARLERARAAWKRKLRI